MYELYNFINPLSGCNFVPVITKEHRADNRLITK
ncbi:hypothetical protein ATK78_0191 [Pedobacter metabolipauper]|uniref:Uncharacterized protein n=1 Tax=Pedobacter metabolipauper TaxID=425513 RepID=A0A4R6SYE3_9SPHI|nr:hypothetical protein ATK78_0191 [Pedobacter metabolipauper]